MKKLISSMMLTLLLIGVLSLAFNIQPVNASGTIHIKADGSIEPSTAPILTFDNITYVFTDDINDSIVVERSNIIIDGNGYTVQGTEASGSKGINLPSVCNVTIKSMEVKAFWYGVYLDYSSNNSVNGNNITNKHCGIYLGHSSNNSISGNNITNNEYGIGLDHSSNNSISGNNITNNEYGVYLDYFSNYNNISRNNIANNGCGIYLYSHSNYNSISGNNITANNYDGIYIYFYSNYNSISGNNITNNADGVYLDSSSNHNSISGNNIANSDYGIYLHSSSNNVISGNTFFKNGLTVWDGSYENVVVDNLVNGKPLVYLEGVSDHTVEDAGQVILVNCSNILVENLNLSHTTGGLLLWGTSNTKISGNNITNNRHGIWFYYSSNNSISGNNITANTFYGIWLYSSSKYNSIGGNNITNNEYGIRLESSSSSSISGNNIANNGRGVWFYYSSNNSISGNNIANNGDGIRLDSSLQNFIYRNDFVDNICQAYLAPAGYTNVWDDGYPSGGNYWNDNTGEDLYSGLYQNETGSDGIGDTPYTIDANNADHYPLIGVFSDFYATSKHCIETICNSTISNFQFNGTAISFNVSGQNGTSGFCRICIPTGLMSGTYRVFVNGTEILPPPEPLPCSNSTHTYLYFTYELSTKEVVMVPEFSSLLILSLFMITTLLAVIVHKRKHNVNQTK